MQYSYTVTLQQSKHAPKKFKTTASDIHEVIQKIKKLFTPDYHIRAIVRNPK